MLRPNLTPGSRIWQPDEDTWRLQIPSGPAGQYRLAQLDDYAQLSRGNFPWYPPFSLHLRARVSSPDLAGTWGFGLWNDPFSFSLGFGGERHLPALPNAVWFFYASPPNYLSLRDDLPAQGYLAATFQSPLWPSLLTLLAVPLAPLFFIPFAACWLRRLGRRFIRQDAIQLSLDATQWHDYHLQWTSEAVTFLLDGSPLLSTPIVPQPPLGMVIWIDNQYAAFPPQGHPTFGTLPTPEPAWIEVSGIEVSSTSSK